MASSAEIRTAPQTDVAPRNICAPPVGWSPAALRQQRQLPRLGRLAGLVGQAGRIFAGEAMVGELRPRRVAPIIAHRLVDAVDREKSKRVRADELPHLFQRVRSGEKLV